MSATETYTLSIVGSPINGPTVKRLILTEKKEDKKGKVSIKNKILGEFDNDTITHSAIGGKSEKVQEIYKELKQNIQSAKNNSDLFMGIKPAGLAAIARSLEMNTAELKEIIIALTSDTRPEFMIEEERFTTRNAASAMGHLAAGAGPSDPSSFAGMFQGSASGATFSLPKYTANSLEINSAVQAFKIIELIAIAASMDDATVDASIRAALSGGRRKKQHGGMTPEERAAASAAAVAEGNVAPATVVASTRRRGRTSASVASTAGGADVGAAAGGAEAGAALVSNAGGVSVIDTAVENSTLAAIGDRLAARASAAATLGVTATISTQAVEIVREAGRSGIPAIPMAPATAAQIASISATTSSSGSGGASAAAASTGAGGSGGASGSRPSAALPAAPQPADIRNALVGHLAEWMNANGTFIKNGKDEIMRKLYDFAAGPTSKKIIKKTATVTSVATGTAVVASGAAAFIAPGAVLDIYLKIFSLITGAATTLIATPINIMSKLIINFLFYIPDSYKYKLFFGMAEQVGDLGSSVGLQALILRFIPAAASIPGFATGMFVIDLAIGAYILFNLHRSMGALSPFKITANAAKVTFEPLLEAVARSAQRISDDVRICTDYLRDFMSSLCGKAVAVWNSPRTTAVGTAMATGTRGVGRGLSNVVGLGNTVFWLIVSRGWQGCRAVGELFDASSRLFIPHAAVGFPLLTNATQQRNAEAIIKAMPTSPDAVVIPLPAAADPLPDVLGAATALSSAVASAAASAASSTVDTILTNTLTASAGSGPVDDTDRFDLSGSGGTGIRLPAGGASANRGGGGGGGTGLGGGRRRRRTHKRRNHKRRVHKTKKHPKRR